MAEKIMVDIFRKKSLDELSQALAQPESRLESGSAAAAVAAGECWYAIGSDTGGSIRQPSSFCGVTGIKPTYGTVSRYGLIAYGSSLDQIGPVAKDVTDCATILETITSYDKKDSTSVQRLSLIHI